jgi:uncharacterized protein
MRDIVERRIPELTLDSKVDGPTAWLTACIHGDEVGGTAIVHDIFATLSKSGLRCGKLHALPLINSLGFENVSRFVNADREDLNRCFPGQPQGSMGEQIAHRLFDTIAKTRPALVIDLHNDWIHSVPYVLLEPAELYATRALRRTTLRIARSTRQLLVQEPTSESGMQRTLTGALVRAGIAAFTIEAGGAYGIAEDGVGAGKAAVLAALADLGMIEAPDARNIRRPEAVHLAYTNKPLCTSSGLVRFTVAAGDRVEADQVVARIFSAFGSCEETLRARAPGYVLGVADHARAVPGSEVIAIGELQTPL